MWAGGAIYTECHDISQECQDLLDQSLSIGDASGQNVAFRNNTADSYGEQ